MTVREKNKVLVGVTISVLSTFIVSIAWIVINANTTCNKNKMDIKQIQKDQEEKADKWQILVIDEKLNYIIETVNEIKGEKQK